MVSFWTAPFFIFLGCYEKTLVKRKRFAKKFPEKIWKCSRKKQKPFKEIWDILGHLKPTIFSVGQPWPTFFRDFGPKNVLLLLRPWPNKRISFGILIVQLWNKVHGLLRFKFPKLTYRKFASYLPLLSSIRSCLPASKPCSFWLIRYSILIGCFNTVPWISVW